MTAIVKLEGVKAGYPGKVVLCGTDFTMEPGSMVAITGPNGTGKTTLFRVILGLLAPLAGSVEMLGTPLTRGNAAELRRSIGYVPQQSIPGRLPLTVRDAVMMGRWGSSYAGLRRPTRVDLDAVDGVLGDMGLSEYRDFDIRELSGGLQQRMALARAIVREPRLVLMDEPTTYLDRGSQQQIMDLAGTLNSRLGIAFMIISHDASVIDAKSMRVVVMRDGVVVDL